MVLCDFNWNKECNKITKEEYEKDTKENWYNPAYYEKCNSCEDRKKSCSCGKAVGNQCRACQESANSRF